MIARIKRRCRREAEPAITFNVEQS